MSYFEQIILPSTKMEKQESYSIGEAAHILDTNRKNVQRYARNFKNQTGKIRLPVEKDGTISYDAFVNFFEQ